MMPKPMRVSPPHEAVMVAATLARRERVGVRSSSVHQRAAVVERANRCRADQRGANPS